VTLTALSWTKTAFAVTLLRLTTDGTRKFVWFIIVSLQITMGFSAAVPWIQCNPIAKTWEPMLPGSCWANKVGTKIWIGTGGSWPLCCWRTADDADTRPSILGLFGLYAGCSAVDISLGASLEERREGRYLGCHEHGCCVSSLWPASWDRL
jgi:hypothetical protein